MAKTSRRTPSEVLCGTAAAPGIAVGPVLRIEDPAIRVEEWEVPEADREREVARFRSALEGAREELTRIRERTGRDLGEDSARVFDVQLMVLQDPLAVDRTEEAIRKEGKNAEFLFRRHMLEMIDRLEGISDAYFSERAVDLLDVKRRVLRHLDGEPETPPSTRRGVLLGREIAPSDAVRLDPSRVLGVATDLGGATGHAAIMARARGIPAVVGVRGLSDRVSEGDVIAVDGFRGRVTVNPDPRTVAKLRERKRSFTRSQRRREKLTALPAETRDGYRILLAANMELPQELDYIRSRGAEGIGLFRTEFLFMRSRRAPTEDEQVAVYREALEAIDPGPVVFRVLDLGGDKIASYMGIAREQNPFLGQRGIRYLLAHPDVFATQVRAILRAAVVGAARILLPMVTSLDELHQARALIRRTAASLKRRKIPLNDTIPVGVMIEVPSVVMMADEFARDADFLSVGSNDLIQYLLAIDRGNEALQEMYQPYHPAVLRAFRDSVEAAHRREKRIAICGEMAGDPRSVPLLLGLGFDRLSVSPSLVPEVKQAVRALRHSDCKDLARDALGAESAEEVLRLVEERLGSRYSDLLRMTRENGAGASPSPRRPGKKR